jgi:hypothetical protein
MLVVLSTGLLTALTGTGVSMIAPAFAIDDDCEDNGDDSCNELTQKTEQETKCKIVNENENDDHSDSNSNRDFGTGDITCSNSIIIGENDEVSNEPGDILLCHRPPGNEDQSQTLSLSQNAVDSHLANHPADELGACPAEG